MAGKPHVFVSRIIPDAGLNLIRQHCDAEIWAARCRRLTTCFSAKGGHWDLVSLLTDRIDAASLDVPRA